MFTSKQQSSSVNTSAPNIPDWLNNSIEGVGTAITNLGNRNPQDFVPGASGLQQQAFGMASNLASRYGAPQPQYAQTAQGGGGQPQQQPMSSGGGLFESLGVSSPETPNYNSYMQSNPDVMQAYNSLTPQQRSQVAQVIGEPSGQITPEQFGQFHYNQHGQSEGRSPVGKTSQPEPELVSAGVVNSGGGQYRPNGQGNQMAMMGQPVGNGAMMLGGPFKDPVQSGIVGATSGPQNSLDMYGDAADAARSVINAGPNQVGSAETYNPAQAGTAQVQSLPGYDAAQTGGAQLGNVALGQSAQVGNMNGYNAAQAGQVQLDPTQQISGTSYDAAQARAGKVQAQSLLTNLQDYMNPYTDDVVDTTLAGYDENAGRIEAQQAAAAAANGAFGGSRYAVQEGITQGELARERAATEAGLRSDAFNTGAGLSADDANRRQSASSTNASLKTQASLANQAATNTARQFGAQSVFNAQQSNQQTDLSRLLSQGQLDRDVGLANQSAANSASEFGANAQNQGLFQQAGLDQESNLYNAGASNQAAQFNANSINDMGQFNASQADNALQRALQGADSLRNTGSTQEANERAAISLLEQLGATQRGISGEQANADIGLLSTITQLLGGLPLSQITGISESGSQTSRYTPSTMDSIGQTVGIFKDIASMIPVTPAGPT